MVSASATIELSTLLRQYQLGLVLITGLGKTEPEDVHVQWVHGTDLADPTAFVTPRTVLLTTGSQFTGRNNTAAKHREYVAKLTEAGVCALGFGINFGHERIPEALVNACEQYGLPLFRVPYSTPFIAISQTAARLINDQARERDVWSIGAQRSVALAALQETGLTAVIRELSQQLNSWVGLFDSDGHLIANASLEHVQPTNIELVRADVHRMLTSQTRASRATSHADERILLQTLGRGGRLLGVLAIQDRGDLDYAAQSVISIVVALGSITLEQYSALSTPREQLRGAVIDLLAESRIELASQVSQRVFGGLPDAPILCASLDADSTASTALSRALRQREHGHPSEVFVAERDGEMLVIFSKRIFSEIKSELHRTHSIVGISLETQYEHFAQALQQARLALSLARSQSHETITQFSTSMQVGVLELLEHSDVALDRARALLSPLIENDLRNDENMIESLTTWLRHHGQYAPAATDLNIHRHTLKSRIARAAQLLGKDLNDVSVRADTWAALELNTSSR